MSKYLGAARSREILIKGELETDPSYGFQYDQRPVEVLLKYSVINLDKPVGPNSHEIVAWIRRILGIERVAHAGTLDPKVSGILPIVLNNAVRALPVLLQEDKEYVCVMRLHDDVDRERLERVISMFKGSIYQRPPLRSAVKRTLRIRRIYDIRLLEVDGRDVLLQVWCEAGTYMRKLCHDIGEILGVGAHMQELRRIRSGSLTEEKNLATLHDVVDSFLLWKEHGIEEYLRRVFIPIEEAVQHIPKLWIRDTAVDAVCHGAPLAVPGIVRLESGVRVGDRVGIFTLKGELVAIGTAKMTSSQIMASKSGIAVEVNHVIMEPGTYPRAWKSRGEEGDS
ncbi:RNA-guided pseudouridylation complex pseudouridine synthase subunit Cbf5 [Infirmifilum lucidum]|uniref:Probable tRNA pseudouridine synthase B n=1 Tax=Infirmifilum lucidum TaxID=2776706 RepID=A0A7L9FE99_9CREN|nr:RNA-guided pseudouridylation complex pseudouridine synthase subunit Cbf5 [Infirmifilum lucidum]QOJ78120.1 RNA-guided pseudouridylation complex pseudouridine synthase subunit Cbf5 [Infirmifilum lucidum]